MASKRYKIARFVAQLDADEVWLPDGAVILDVSYEVMSESLNTLDIGNNLWKFRLLQQKWRSGGYNEGLLHELAKSLGIIPISPMFLDGTVRMVIKALVPAPKPREGKYA